MREVLSPVVILKLKQPPLFFDPIISKQDPINRLIHNILKDLKFQAKSHHKNHEECDPLQDMDLQLCDPVIDADTPTIPTVQSKESNTELPYSKYYPLSPLSAVHTIISPTYRWDLDISLSPPKPPSVSPVKPKPFSPVKNSPEKPKPSSPSKKQKSTTKKRRGRKRRRGRGRSKKQKKKVCKQPVGYSNQIQKTTVEKK